MDAVTGILWRTLMCRQVDKLIGLRALAEHGYVPPDDDVDDHVDDVVEETVQQAEVKQVRRQYALRSEVSCAVI